MSQRGNALNHALQLLPRGPNEALAKDVKSGKLGRGKRIEKRKRLCPIAKSPRRQCPRSRRADKRIGGLTVTSGDRAGGDNTPGEGRDGGSRGKQMIVIGERQTTQTGVKASY